MHGSDLIPCERSRSAPRRCADVQRLLTIMTTEHYTLQMARSATIAEASNRTGQYLTALSAILVALSLVAQVFTTRTLLALATTLFTALYLIGLLTFLRTNESSVEDIRCGYGINRIRHLYTELDPRVGERLITSTHDDIDSVERDAGRQDRPQILGGALSTAGFVNVVNSLVAGAAVASCTALVEWATWIVVVAGLAAACTSFILLNTVHRHLWRRAIDQLDSLHPATRL